METTTNEARDRWRTCAWILLPLIVLGAVLRVVLYTSFRDTPFELSMFAYVLAVGAVLDTLAYGLMLAPAILGLTLLSGERNKRRFIFMAAAVLLVQSGLYLWANQHSGWIGGLISLSFLLFISVSLCAGRVLARPKLRRVVLVGFFAIAAFSTAIEYFFFEEFNSRYNHIALDYVLYPSEVATNIWESYPVVVFVLGALVVGTGCVWIFDRRTRRTELSRVPWGIALKRGIVASTALGVAALAASAVPASLAEDRITSEIAQNGLLQLVRAFRTAELDYTQYYTTLSTDEARSRAAKVLDFPLKTAVGGALTRAVSSARPAGSDPLDVVVVLVESLGSDFIGALGAEPNDLTPEFDRWSQSGLLLTNLIANGNRTVRGLEGVLCSFVPLPGDSITKRSPPADAATLARVFAANGYETTFLYGGAGAFDGMEPFMSKNGWGSFVQQRDYPVDCFTTAWGVADEHIFDALLERQTAAHAAKKRFFGTVVTVSNHKPYLVPKGRTARADQKPSRFGAVSYTDWAIGRWLDAARERGLLEHTLVLIVGDHGARVYGRELIPVQSYRIPALFLSPDAAWKGKRTERLCSQIDLAPTVLALAGIASQVPFLGSDLTREAKSGGRAFVQHNRDVGLMTDEMLVVLGLKKTVTYYRRGGASGLQLTHIADHDVTADMRDLEKDAAAVCQYAYETYRAGLYVEALPER